MKKNDLLILVAVIVYSYLFYNQNPGINYLIFTLCLTMLLYLKDPQIRKHSPWLGAATGAILTGLCVLAHSTSLAVFANILSLCLLASFSINKDSSIIIAGLHSLYSYLISVPNMIFRSKDNWKQKQPSNQVGKKILIGIIPAIVTMIYFIIYREANPVFKNLTNNFSLDFISWRWIRFVLLGWILLYAFFNHIDIPFLSSKDKEGKDLLDEETFISLMQAERVAHENLSGIILFALLNFLLLIVNIVDIQSLWISQSLPEGLSHAEFVHQGVGLLILSIVIAISIILFYFRGALNFTKNNPSLRLLAYIWILQNVLVIITTSFKNQLYIDEYSLTQKRIGVYIYLLLSLIGLLTTYLKIKQKKSNWFLFRKNGWAFYAILVASCFINWDLLITRYNIAHSEVVDQDYLASLSESTLPDLVKLNISNKPVSPFKTHQNGSLSDKNIYHFFEKGTNVGWQSWDFDEARIKGELTELNRKSIFTSLDLTGYSLETLSPITSLNNIKVLSLGNTGFKNLGELESFPQLERLALNGNNMDSIPALNAIPSLKELDISANALSNLRYLEAFPNLTVLNVSHNKAGLFDFPELPNLEVLDIAQSKIFDVKELSKYTHLKELKIGDNPKEYLEELKPIPDLKALDVSSMSISEADTSILGTFTLMQAVKKLNMSRNNISNLSFLSGFHELPLEDLNLSSNPLQSLQGIENLPLLKKLELNDCNLTSLNEIASLQMLESLSVNKNNLGQTSSIPYLPKLKNISISSMALSDLSILMNVYHINTLNISHTGISDIHSLKEFRNLSTLNICHTGITDLSPLLSIPKLHTLYIDTLSQDGINIIKKIKGLKGLYCTKLSQETIDVLKREIPGIYIEVAPEDSSRTDISPDYTM